MCLAVLDEKELEGMERKVHASEHSRMLSYPSEITSLPVSEYTGVTGAHIWSFNGYGVSGETAHVHSSFLYLKYLSASVYSIYV